MSDEERAEANRAEPRRGPRPGEPPTGWPLTRVLLALTAVVAAAATVVLVAVALGS